MENIKFRIWHEQHKHMTTNFKIGETLNDAFKSDSVVFMQYTGVEDSNGVEIYEGDILEVDDDVVENYFTEVVFNGGAFCINVLGLDYSYTAVGWATDGFNGIYGLKVVGNVRQNPELLGRLV